MQHEQRMGLFKHLAMYGRFSVSARCRQFSCWSPLLRALCGTVSKHIKMSKHQAGNGKDDDGVAGNEKRRRKNNSSKMKTWREKKTLTTTKTNAKRSSTFQTHTMARCRYVSLNAKYAPLKRYITTATIYRGVWGLCCKRVIFSALMRVCVWVSVSVALKCKIYVSLCFMCESSSDPLCLCV